MACCRALSFVRRAGCCRGSAAPQNEHLVDRVMLWQHAGLWHLSMPGTLCRCVTALKQGASSTSPSTCFRMQADVRKGPAPGSSCSGERSARDTSSWLLRVVLALHQAQLRHSSGRGCCLGRL